ncbi:hypothetical protein BLOT_016777 [Blomia tropicalis]|nr:hypothetical protein BLOT_016777 [Blomia tropicalis]
MYESLETVVQIFKFITSLLSLNIIIKTVVLEEQLSTKEETFKPTIAMPFLCLIIGTLIKKAEPIYLQKFFLSQHL